jgi:serine/threonine protein kinase/WD40 repeat protein/tetratricopeptide (TPR) repeat protein
MSSVQNQAKVIFLDAVEISGPGERQAYVAAQCGGDEALRRDVEGLLAHYDPQGRFLEAGARGPCAIVDGPVVSECPGTIIGPYKLLQQIGEGGFGAVFMAEQTQPVRRKVALKVIKAGMDSRQVIARFEAERQALAMMDHQNIARVLDVGTTETGRPFFVMELVHGIPITKYCDDNHLTPRERLELFVPVCQAIQHAHQKGVIHRDVKPSNVMVTLYDGKPVPKVIDFGIAKATEQSLTERTMFTQFGQMVGTLEYMSPEQAEMSALGVDTRSDIYSLGVLLYELLTGSTPLSHKRLKEATYADVLRMIKEEEPPKPSTRLSTTEELPSIALNRGLEPTKLRGLVRGELDWIVMKALEKDRDRRYETANSLCRDIQRYLNDEPVQACPPSATYRLRKLVRRNKGPVLAASLLVLALVGGIIGTTLGMIRATHALAVAHEADRDKTEKLWTSLVERARALRSSGSVGQRFEALKAIREAAKIKITSELRDEAVAALCRPDVEIVQEWEGIPDETFDWNYDATFTRYARLSKKGELTVCRRTEQGEEVIAHLPPYGKVRWGKLWMSPDGRFLVYGHSGLREGTAGGVRVWKLDGTEPTVLLDEPLGMHEKALAFHGDGRRLAIGHADQTISVYDLETGKRVRRMQIGKMANALAFHPRDGRLAAACYSDIRLFNVDTGKALPRLCDSKITSWQYSLAWHPDGRRLAATSDDRKIHIWDTETAAEAMAPLEGHLGNGISMEFNHAGDRLLGMDWNGQSLLWDAATGRQLLSMHGANGYRFSQDDSVIGLARSGSKLRLWRLADGRELRILRRPGTEIEAGNLGPVLDADGRVLVAVSKQGLSFFDMESGQELASARFKNDGGVVWPISYHRSYGWMTCGLGGLLLWPATLSPSPPLKGGDKGRAPDVLRVGPPERLASTENAGAGASASKDGRIIAVPQGNQTLVFDTGRPGWRVVIGPHHDVRSCAVSPDGRWVVTCSHWWDGHSKSVRIWEAESGRHVLDLPLEGLSNASFSPDGRWLSTVTGGRGSYLWEVGTWREARRFGLAYSKWIPNSQWLALTEVLGVIRFVEPDTGREVFRLPGPEPRLYYATCFSPDGTRVIAHVTGLEAIYVWDLRLIRERLKELGLDWDWPEFKPAPKAQRSRAPLAVTVDAGHLALPEPPMAVALFSLAIALNPLNPEAYHQRGMAYGRLNDHRKAIDDYSTFLSLTPRGSPGRVDVLLRRGNNYDRLNDSAGALADLKQLLALDPREVGSLEHPLALLCNNVAWGQVAAPQKELPSQVLALAQKSTELEPYNILYRNTLGVVFYRLSRYQEAIDCLEHNLKTNHDLAAFDLYFLAMSYQRLGQQAKAKDCFERANAWRQAHTNLSAAYTAELTAFHAEAAKLLGIKSGQ